MLILTHSLYGHLAYVELYLEIFPDGELHKRKWNFSHDRAEETSIKSKDTLSTKQRRFWSNPKTYWFHCKHGACKLHHHYLWHRGSKPVACRFWLFLSDHILHCICFKILFTESKYLVSNWSVILVWLEQSKKWKISNKKVKMFCANIILCNRYSIIYQYLFWKFWNLLWTIKGFILYQIEQTTLKLGYNFTTYGKFTSWIEELLTRKPLSPIWASSSVSRKWHATGFEPLRHISGFTAPSHVYINDTGNMQICIAHLRRESTEVNST